MSEPPHDLTYYNRPLLKESVWSIDIPLYYFLGGSAGAAMTLAAALQLASKKGRSDLRRVSAVCHWTGIIGSTLGAVFLVHDLGRPERFLYMMRVFRPTSPMNMGVWILSGAAPASIAAGFLVNRRGPLGALGEACGYVAGAFGAALAGYTGVLVSTTAIPIWQAARRWMPVLFLASSASSASGLIEIFDASDAARKVTRVFGTAGRVAELAAAHQVEHAASAVPRVGQPLREGATSILWRGATLLTAASLAASLLPSKSQTRRVAAGVLAVAGSLCLRFAVHYIGDASARDARASFQQQRSSGG